MKPEPPAYYSSAIKEKFEFDSKDRRECLACREDL